MIDAPVLPTDAVKWREEIAKRGEVRYIINTHHHLDHVGGNCFFPGTVISHEGLRKVLPTPVTSVEDSERLRDLISAAAGLNVAASERLTEAFRAGQLEREWIRLLTEELDPEGLPLLEDYELKVPTITFSERLSLYVGEHTFELIHLPGHTQEHIGVYIPREKVFFTGDNFTNETQPNLAISLPLEWVRSLRRIEAMDIEVIVPGHGEVCDKAQVREFRLFIQKCIDRTKQAIKQGMSKEEAAGKLSFEGLNPGGDRGVAVHPGPRQQRSNVLRFYEMLYSNRVRK
jgi:cyclase